MELSRRSFLAVAAMSSASAVLGTKGSAQTASMQHDHPADAHAAHNHPKPVRPVVPRLPVLICKMTPTIGVDAAYTMLKERGDTLDAVLHVTRTQEDDPNDHSAGLGGLPNEQGEVQLDACCLHGPTGRVGSVAGVSGIKNASLLARAVMEDTGYSQIVGADAHRFALARGFQKEELNTERTRKNWALWKSIQSAPELVGSEIYDPSWPRPARKTHSMPVNQRDLDELVNKLEPYAVRAGLGPEFTWRAVYDALFPEAEPLYVSAVNEKQEVSSAATTSGLPWRQAGVTGDVAMVGAGCYLDPEIGSAGSSGNAEANIRIAGAHTIVENMRRGMSPEDAGMDALRRIVKRYKNDMTALRFVEMVYYILRVDGSYESVSLWRGDKTGHVRQFTIKDAENMRRSEDCKFLFDGNPPNGCPNCNQVTQGL
ncbi:isoaspartyl peptidase/L-asparaginase [Tunturiibacter psychrotolerans]|uniref:isoaspartyl peptidase/L-asparaginase n=1 Tax=Tunturiibacter psychrotolerans TaxID=3069686 RepID=UPI003D22BF96